jgi:hypothetical protein
MNHNRELRLDNLAKGLQSGRVYRASELERYSNSLGRDLRLLVDTKKLRSLGKGLYVKPEKLGDMELSPDSKEVVSKFLGSNRFLMRNMSDFNSFGLGLTQMFKDTFVYNSKRTGKIKLGNREYHFVNRKFPKDHHDEFLLVDLFNNLDAVGENKERLRENFEDAWKRRVWPLDYEKVYDLSQKYGKNWVKRYFRKLRGEDGFPA